MIGEYQPKTLTGNWLEKRLEPGFSEAFSGIEMPTSYAQTFKTTYSEMTKFVTSSKFKAPSENWLSGGHDAANDRYESATRTFFKPPKQQKQFEYKLPCSLSDDDLVEYRKQWTVGDSQRFQ